MAEGSGKPAKIISFGFKHGFPQEEARHTVIDVRAMFQRNPYRNKKLRQLTGLDPAVGKDILLTPGFNYSWGALQLRIIEAVKLGSPVVYLGCTGGRHRSVYLADRLGKEWQVPVEHRDIDKPRGGDK